MGAQDSKEAPTASNAQRNAASAPAPKPKPAVQKSSFQSMYEEIAKANGADDGESVEETVVSVEEWQRGGGVQHHASKTFPSGNKYDGEWMNGKYHGKGTLLYSDGRKYQGEWNTGVFHGKGTFYYASGDIYTGEFVAGAQEGQGRLVWRNGDTYTGAWARGKRHGRGTLTKTDGDGFSGMWTAGQPDMLLGRNPHR